MISVTDAVTYNARLIRHRDAEGVLHNIESSKFSLDLSLQTHFSQPHAHVPLDPALVLPHQLCVYMKDNFYYRYVFRQGIINMNKNLNSAIFFSYVCNGKKIKELFASTLNGIAASVRCVSSIIVVLNAK